MTTQSSTTSQDNGWDADFATMQENIATYNADVEKLHQDEAKSHNIFLQMLAGMKDPEVALVLFIMHIFSSADPNDQANMTGIDADLTKITGDRLKVSANLQQLQNDLQDTTNGKGPDAGPGDIQKFAAHLDQILDEIKNNDSFRSVFAPDDVGNTALSSFEDQFTALRNTIYWKEDPEGSTYNPTPVPTPPTGDGTGNVTRTYYFDPDDSGYIQDFAEMKSLMGAQGDPKQASEGSKALSDSEVTLGGTNQGVNAALNAEMTELANYDKSLQAFGSSTAQNVITTTKNAVANQKQS